MGREVHMRLLIGFAGMVAVLLPLLIWRLLTTSQ
jgi:hypothetical protein